MPLLKSFSKVDPIGVRALDRRSREGGEISIPSHIRKKAGLWPGRRIIIKIVRIKDSSRWPYIIVHTLEAKPRLTKFQVIMKEEALRMDEKGRLTLTTDILEEVKLEIDYRVEIKVAGPNQGGWLTIHNRGSNRLTTLQEKMGRLGKGEKKWNAMTIDY